MFDLSRHLGVRVELALDLHSLKGKRARWIVKSHEGAPWSSKKRALNGKANDKNRDITTEVGLRDCLFFVDDKQLKRHRATGKKALYAWVIGTLVPPEEVRHACDVEVVFNGQRYSSFVLVANEIPISNAPMASFRCQEGRLKVFVPNMTAG